MLPPSFSGHILTLCQNEKEKEREEEIRGGREGENEKEREESTSVSVNTGWCLETYSLQGTLDTLDENSVLYKV